jgi:hypothetical protein
LKLLYLRSREGNSPEETKAIEMKVKMFYDWLNINQDYMFPALKLNDDILNKFYQAKECEKCEV